MERPQIAPEFNSMKHFNDEINDVGYARYNYKELLAREAKLTKMVEGAEDTALFNSGAAAMHSVLEAEGLRAGDVVLCAKAIYGTTKADVQSLKALGVRVILFDSTNVSELQEIVNREKPRLIVAETIANSKNMEVTDLSAFGKIIEEANSEYQKKLSPQMVLQRSIEKTPALQKFSEEARHALLSAIAEYRVGHNPFIFRSSIHILEGLGMNRSEAVKECSRLVKAVTGQSRDKLSLVLDNTLPSPQIINPLKVLKGKNFERVIVESGTKHYQEGANEITLGLAYSDSPEKMKIIKSRRIELGTYLQPTDEKKIPATVDQSMPEIMKNHARNALQLAKFISGKKGFTVSHPNLLEHKQSDIVNAMAPEGAVTLFYLTVPEGMTGEEFMQKVKDMAGDKVGLGSSFGHRKTWLSNYGMDSRTVRIAAGSESEQEFQEVMRVIEKL